MAKTQEELTKLKTEYETLSSKLSELSEDELGYVTGGNVGRAIAFGSCKFRNCNLNPDTCTIKKNSGCCPKEGI